MRILPHDERDEVGVLRTRRGGGLGVPSHARDSFATSVLQTLQIKLDRLLDSLLAEASLIETELGDLRGEVEAVRGLRVDPEDQEVKRTSARKSSDADNRLTRAAWGVAPVYGSLL